MGFEDRDWYREEHAKKNGMRYDKKKAVYSAEDWRNLKIPPGKNPPDVYSPKPFRRDTASAAAAKPADMHWAAILCIWLLAVGALFGAFKFYEHYQSQKTDAQVNAIAAKYWKEQAEKAIHKSPK